MKILIDTHIFLWAIYEPKKISKKHYEELQSLSNTVFVSSISFVEIMIKNSVGKLAIDANLIKLVEDSGFELLSFTAHDAIKLKDMPLHHKDPFDRMLIAQALNNSYRMMSNDKKFKLYDCKLV